jgi:hypothetical protein
MISKYLFIVNLFQGNVQHLFSIPPLHQSVPRNLTLCHVLPPSTKVYPVTSPSVVFSASGVFSSVCDSSFFSSSP